ncbi:MAG: hypothetical protein KF685_09385 [Acidobacteria bacterium]|nr:hypothetical protein [Acidobacteriota bacterium]
MEETLKELLGKQVNVGCGNASGFKGEVVTVERGVLCIKDDEDVVSYIAVDKIVFVNEANATHSRPGFVV